MDQILNLYCLHIKCASYEELVYVIATDPTRAQHSVEQAYENWQYSSPIISRIDLIAENRQYTAQSKLLIQGSVYV